MTSMRTTKKRDRSITTCGDEREPLRGALEASGIATVAGLVHQHPHKRAARARRRHAHPHGHGHSHGLVDDRSSARAPACGRSRSRSASSASPPRCRRSSSRSRAASRCSPTSSTTSATPLTAVPLGGRVPAALRARRALRRACSSSPRSSSAPAWPGSRPSPADPPAAPPLSRSPRRAHRVRRQLVAARIRTRAGRRLDSPALIADGHHARADAYVSLAVIASAAVVVAIGLPIADPLIGLAITVVILRITWQSWRTVRGHDHAH